VDHHCEKREGFEQRSEIFSRKFHELVSREIFVTTKIYSRTNPPSARIRNFLKPISIVLVI
jgi:hypothetical protein